MDGKGPWVRKMEIRASAVMLRTAKTTRIGILVCLREGGGRRWRKGSVSEMSLSLASSPVEMLEYCDFS